MTPTMVKPISCQQDAGAKTNCTREPVALATHTAAAGSCARPLTACSFPKMACVQCSHASTNAAAPKAVRNSASATDPRGTSSAKTPNRRCSWDRQSWGQREHGAGNRWRPHGFGQGRAGGEHGGAFRGLARVARLQPGSAAGSATRSPPLPLPLAAACNHDSSLPCLCIAFPGPGADQSAGGA